MTLRKGLLAATILSLPLAAQAQPVTGLYVGAGVGANFRLDPDGDYSRSLISTLGAPTNTASGTAKMSTEPNIMGVLSVGWGFGNGLRAEVEGWFAPEGGRPLSLSIESFSYKRGLPRGLDMVLDCRFLRNPHWDEALRPRDGRDAGVAAFVMADPRFPDFFARVQGKKVGKDREGKGEITGNVYTLSVKHSSFKNWKPGCFAVALIDPATAEDEAPVPFDQTGEVKIKG